MPSFPYSHTCETRVSGRLLACGKTRRRCRAGKLGSGGSPEARFPHGIRFSKRRVRTTIKSSRGVRASELQRNLHPHGPGRMALGPPGAPGFPGPRSSRQAPGLKADIGISPLPPGPGTEAGPANCHACGHSSDVRRTANDHTSSP